jgi:hypothetical protein
MTIPSGYRLIRKAQGVKLYRGGAHYVQVVRLDQGARVSLLHGVVSSWGTGKGVWGGNDARFKFKSLSVYWRWCKIYMPGAWSVVNGAFWKVGQSPATLALPLKAGGTILTDGFMYNAIPQRVNMLEIWDQRAVIRGLDRNAFYDSWAPFVIGGRNFNASMRRLSATGRTMIGVNQAGNTVYIFSSRAARQDFAYNILRRFGASNITQLDGGGSSQMICQGNALVRSSRAVPQVVAVTSG